MTAKMQLQDGKVKWNNSKCPILTKNCWESMENQVNSRRILSQGFSSLQILQKIQDDLRERNMKPGELEDPIICMSVFNDIGCARKGTMEFCISNEEKSTNTQDNGRFCTAAQNGGTIQRCWSSSTREDQCFESWNSEEDE